MILRETVMGRALFDRAFREYARRWYMKHPTPYDFFRTMEESSGVDLDWFWRGWFYSTDHVDIALDKITRWRLDSGDPEAEAAFRRDQHEREPSSLTVERNEEPTVTERDPAGRDYYDRTDEFGVTEAQRKKAKAAQEELTAEDREAQAVRDTFYRFDLRNVGELVMPVILKLEFADGSSETVRLPAEIWRTTPAKLTWEYVSGKDLVRAELDPLREIADADRGARAPRPRHPERGRAGDDVRLTYVGKVPPAMTVYRVRAQLLTDIYERARNQVNLRRGGVTRSAVFHAGSVMQTVTLLD